MCGQHHTGCAELRDVRYDNEGPGEVTAVSGLSRLHSLGPQDDLQGAWDGSTRQLRLRLLDTHLDTHTVRLSQKLISSPVSPFMFRCTQILSHSYLLEVDELGFVCVEVEAGAVVADGVPADGRWGVFELLGDVFDQCLAVHAQEGATHLESYYKDNVITDKLNIFMHHSFLFVLFFVLTAGYLTSSGCTGCVLTT